MDELAQLLVRRDYLNDEQKELTTSNKELNDLLVSVGVNKEVVKDDADALNEFQAVMDCLQDSASSLHHWLETLFLHSF